MKVAIIGTVGVPANYGGFETLAENLVGDYCASDIEYTVFCSSKMYSQKLKQYKNAKLRYIPLKANDIQSIPYDMISLIGSMWKYDVILYLGVSVPILNLLKKISKAKIIANIDGLSKDRDKYSRYHRIYLDYLTRNKIIAPDAIISDNKGIQDYASKEFNRESHLIAYGGDQALVSLKEEEEGVILEKFNLRPKEYAVSICRIEPENNCHVTLKAFHELGKKILFIGNWNKNEYGRNLKKKYVGNDNIIIQDPIYEKEILYALRKNANLYIHGHKVGGTNPSLVEAMFFGIPILCYDVVYNRETTFNKADYYKTCEDLKKLILNHKESGVDMSKLAYDNYTWKSIVKKYETLYRETLRHG